MARDTDEELRELRAEVKELRAQLDSKDDDDDDNEDASTRVTRSVRDVSQRARNTKERVFRGLVHASVESVQGLADVVSAFGGNVLDRNEGKEGESARTTNRRIPEDVITGIADSFDEFLEIPRRAADRFSERYDDRKDED